jgi:catecholate siderophore receptor
VDQTQYVQLGEREVQGIELGIVGKLTDNWELSAGVAKMDTEVKRGLQNQAGLQIVWSPEFTFTSWTTYHTPFGLSIGGGYRYVDSVMRPVTTNGVPPPPNQTNMRTAPDYWVIDLMASYDISDNITLQLNGYNITDEEYVATLNNSGARYSPGPPRSALLTVNFAF